MGSIGLPELVIIALILGGLGVGLAFVVFGAMKGSKK